jgi:hypothetical protein
MLSFEWRELEVLTDRLSDLRHLYATTKRSGHRGLVERLKKEIAIARRHRELLVQHIAARVGSAAAAGNPPADAADAPGSEREPLR